MRRSSMDDDRVIMDWSVITARASLYSNSHLLGLAGISKVDFMQYTVRYAVFFLGRLGIQASIQYLNPFKIFNESSSMGLCQQTHKSSPH